MLLFKQLELLFDFSSARPLGTKRGRDFALEERARILLHSLGAGRIANAVRVQWHARLRTAAGRADYGRKLITLNPRLCDFGEEEVERTFLHELAHLLAHCRAGRRRIPPHGDEWRTACEDLGIGGETRCHSLPSRGKNARALGSIVVRNARVISRACVASAAR